MGRSLVDMSFARVVTAACALWMIACSSEAPGVDASTDVDGGVADDAAADAGGALASETECELDGTLVVCWRWFDPRPGWVDDEYAQVLQLELEALPSEPLSFDGEIDLVWTGRPYFRGDGADPMLVGFVPAGVFVSAQIRRTWHEHEPQRYERAGFAGTLTPRADGCLEVSAQQAELGPWNTAPWSGVACP